MSEEKLKPVRKRKPRPTPKERLAEHLQKLGYDVEAEDITHVHGGIYKVLNDVLEFWRVYTKKDGKDIEIQGGGTVSECARGITLKPNRPETCLYGDLIAYPIKYNDRHQK